MHDFDLIFFLKIRCKVEFAELGQRIYETRKIRITFEGGGN